MREESFIKIDYVQVLRITPAHAGRIKGLQLFLYQSQDHPRACGKNVDGVTPNTVDEGSPPRMREEFI